ncbi:basic secretory protein-like protein [Phenylobacterium sp.]|uniref:basic secretory protein-like protein n=1 Tax=Phenylobacterium sp. TaxID=1871053 RepID=UPI0012284FA2|nr:basic secretory protein-like protein [Phenylobacterium sp.]THD64694.1 MAG: hypothetical protein E8A49_01195 [Phenylobacterium sp.]
MRHAVLNRRHLLAALGAMAATPAVGRAGPDGLFEVQWHVELTGAERAALGAWLGRLQAAAAGWWPRITAALASPGFTPTDRIILDLNSITPKTIPAATRGDRIIVDAAYVLSMVGNPDRLGMVAHEMVHVAQAYPPFAPSFLTEGIADYLRYYVLLPQDPGRGYDGARSGPWDGYQVTGGLLDFIERAHPGTVQAVNADLRAGGDGIGPLHKAAGPLTHAWRDYLETHPAAGTSEALAARVRALTP